MQYKILCQAGHQNTASGQTGAPEEVANNIRIRDRLGQILISKGFQVFLCDANFVGKEDYHLALSLHCDANYQGNEGGGFVDYPAKYQYGYDGNQNYIQDYANEESKRIKEAIAAEYFEHSGIRNVPARSNNNTKYYYWWSMVTAKTPCVILEMGESVDPHDKVILADTDRVANAIARGICKAFNIQFEPPPVLPPSPEDTTDSFLSTFYEQVRGILSRVFEDLKTS
jgi:N-acetylmuramoyl-L-alanine amidase